MTPLDIAQLESLLAAWTIGREKRLLVQGDELFWQLLVDGQPTTVPQTCAEFSNPSVDLPLIVALVNAAPQLLAIARAARELQDMVDLTDPRCPIGVALTRVGLATGFPSSQERRGE